MGALITIALAIGAVHLTGKIGGTATAGASGVDPATGQFAPEIEDAPPSDINGLGERKPPLTVSPTIITVPPDPDVDLIGKRARNNA